MPTGTELAVWDDAESYTVSSELVKPSGTGPAGQVIGDLENARTLSLRCPTTGGALGVAQIQVSWNSGGTWGTAFTAQNYNDIGNGVAVLFASGTSFNTSAVYYAECMSWLDQSPVGNHLYNPTTATVRFGNATSPIGGPGIRGGTNSQNLYCLGIRSSLVAAGVSGSFSCFFAGRRTASSRQSVFGGGQTVANYPMAVAFGGISAGDRKIYVARRGSSDGAAIAAETGQILPNHGNLFAAGVTVAGGSANFYVYPSSTPAATIALAAATGSYTAITSETLTGIGCGLPAQQFISDLHALHVAPQTAFSAGDVQSIWDSMTARWGAF